MNGIIRRIQETYDKGYKLRLHNALLKQVYAMMAKNWIINNRHAQKLEAAQMRFLRPLLRLIGLYHERNPDIDKKLKVGNIVEDIKLCQKNWLDHLKRMDKSHRLKLAFHYQPRGRRKMGRSR
jgi:hypothetical protein